MFHFQVYVLYLFYAKEFYRSNFIEKCKYCIHSYYSHAFSSAAVSLPYNSQFTQEVGRTAPKMPSLPLITAAAATRYLIFDFDPYTYIPLRTCLDLSMPCAAAEKPRLYPFHCWRIFEKSSLSVWSRLNCVLRGKPWRSWASPNDPPPTTTTSFFMLTDWARAFRCKSIVSSR